MYAKKIKRYYWHCAGFSNMLHFVCKTPFFTTIRLHFNNVVGARPLRLGDSLNKYTNANGDDFFVTTFKYYISNILLRQNGRTGMALSGTDKANLQAFLATLTDSAFVNDKRFQQDY